MKVIVSACLAGDNCKYNGGNNLNQKIMDFLQSHEIIKVCPEVLGGLPIPRPSAEIVEGQVMNNEGKNVTEEFTLGAQKAFEIVQKENPDLIILQSRSPSCGIKQIYDGTFSGRKIPGHGLFAALCINAGYKVLDIEDIDEYLSKKLINSRNTFNIRRNTRAQKLPFHLPAVFGKRFPQCNSMPSVGIRYLVHGIHETLLFDVFHGVYPEPALILGRHNVEQRNHHNLVAVAFTEDMG